MQTLWLRRIALASAFACAGRAAAAQSIRGVVADSQSGRPIAGAVVLLMNAGGFVVNRTVTSELGAYTIRRDSLAVKGQVLRLGFRPRIISAAELASADASGELSIRIVAIPQLLEPMTSRAGASCPKRRDRAAAFGFWEQAKAGLMASVYARDSSPGFFSTLIYEKYLARNTDSVTLQRVRADSGMWPRTFFAAFTAKDFVDVGFLRNTGDGKATYFGPDAEVLLESDFQTRYCFSLAARDPKRPTQVGLHFEPVRPRSG